MLCRKHFSTLLQGDDNTNAAFRDVLNPIDDDIVEIPPPSHEEVEVAIMPNCLRPDVMSW